MTQNYWLHTARGCYHRPIAYPTAPVTTSMFCCPGTQIYDPDIRDESSNLFVLNEFNSEFQIVLYNKMLHLLNMHQVCGAVESVASTEVG